MLRELDVNDAVGIDVTGIWLALKQRGVKTFVFTKTGESNSPMRTLHYADIRFMLDSPDDLLIYHGYTDDVFTMAVLRRLHCRLVVRTHPFIHGPANRMIDDGRLEHDLISNNDMAICAYIDSIAFAGGGVGRDRRPDRVTFVSPPFHDVSRLLARVDDPGIMAELSKEQFNILAVRPFSTASSYDDLFTTLTNALDQGVDFKLHVVGEDGAKVRAYIGRFLASQRRSDIGGHVTVYEDTRPAVYATLMKHCDLLWAVDSLGGFYMPALEAMASGTPILTNCSPTILEICGDAALHCAEPTDLTSSLIRFARDLDLRFELAALGRRRFESAYRGGAIQRRFLTVFDQIEAAVSVVVPASSLAIDGYWFGIPNAERLVTAALDVSKPLHPNALLGQDRRMDFVDWILRDAWKRSEEVGELLRGVEFSRFVDELELPGLITQFSGPMRLVWKFHRFANATFNLRSPGDIFDFIRWFNREAPDRYGYLAELTVSKP